MIKNDIDWLIDYAYRDRHNDSGLNAFWSISQIIRVIDTLY